MVPVAAVELPAIVDRQRAAMTHPGDACAQHRAACRHVAVRDQQQAARLALVGVGDRAFADVEVVVVGQRRVPVDGAVPDLLQAHEARAGFAEQDLGRLAAEQQVEAVRTLLLERILVDVEPVQGRVGFHPPGSDIELAPGTREQQQRRSVVIAHGGALLGPDQQGAPVVEGLRGIQDAALHVSPAPVAGRI